MAERKEEEKGGWNKGDGKGSWGKAAPYQKGGKGKGDGKGKGYTKGTGKSGITCWNCQQTGHSMRNCPNMPKGFQGNCHNCRIWGHPARECPKPVNEVNDKTEEASGEEQASDTDAVAWGGAGILSVEQQWKVGQGRKHNNREERNHKREHEE